MAHATKRGTGILPRYNHHGQDGHATAPAYAVVYAFSICFFTAACAAASRAMGTR
jgi:hypothetical protein